MTPVLLDTCALIWWTSDTDKLSEKAFEACNKIKSHGAFISSVSIWEIGIKIKNKKIDIGCSISEFVNNIYEIDKLEIIPVDEITWLQNLSLDWEHKDPADRTIVATAKLRNIPIITKDPLIRNFYSKTIW
ncbi:MAG TPA: PIN domain nuclease [Lentisphaeria bacterium]|nr:MAG: twitching motility protein PilT [Lentisphaerae bacterium GWF2_50_93]HCE45306.1 PIN domain nuclease [Lentisphaeria bacterium]